MSAPLFRPLFVIAMFAAVSVAILGAAPSASAEAPARWSNEGCHGLDAGRVLCFQDQGLFSDRVSESGRWTSAYRGDTRWTVYDAGGAVEYQDRTQIHVVAHGDGSETLAEHETFRYRYKGGDYSCRVSSQVHFADGEVRIDHEVGECTIE